MPKITTKRSLTGFEWHAALICLTAVVSVWFGLLSWKGKELLSTFDGITSHLPLLMELARVGGDPDRLLYRPSLIGGSPIADSAVIHPVTALIVRLGGSPTLALNCLHLLLQTLIGSFAALCVLLLVSPAKTSRPDPAVTFGCALAFSFLPAVTLRLGAGQFSLVFALLSLLVPLAWVLAARAERLSFSLLLGGTLTLAISFRAPGAQLLHGTALALIFYLVWILQSAKKIRSPQELLAQTRVPLQGWYALGLWFATFLATSPTLWRWWHNFTFPPFPASPSNREIYSYGVQNWRDVISAISFFPKWPLLERPALQWHEFFIPIGPFLWPLMIWWRKQTSLAIRYCVAFVVFTFALSLKSPGFETLSRSIPYLGSFRCPHRLQLALVFFFSLVSLVSLLRAYSEKRKAPTIHYLLAISLAIIGSRFPGAVTDILGHLAILVLVMIALFRPKLTEKIPRGSIALLVGLICLQAFHSLRPHPVQTAPLAHFTNTLREQVTKAKPELNSPLVRAIYGLSRQPLGVNTPFSAGLSSLDGYWPMSPRLETLISSLDATFMSPRASQILQLPQQAHSFPVLRQLYNVRFAVRESPQGADKWLIDAIGPTPGSSWFSPALVPMQDWPSLARKLQTMVRTNQGFVATAAPFLLSDNFFHSNPLPPLLGAGCEEATVLATASQQAGQEISIEVSSPAVCPLTVATNFTPLLRAYAHKSSGELQPLQTFPAWGSLLAVIVPRHTQKILIRPEPTVPWFVTAAQWVGWALVVTTLALFALPS